MGPVIAAATSDGYRSSRRRGRAVNRYTALGQPTQIASATQTYASAIAYWPNGALKQFTYGNGIVHSLTQNARQLPLRSQDLDGSAPVHDDSYTYDANGNVAAIADSVPGNHGNRSMTYDALDRLTDVSSPMYGATGAHYSYDVLDNITGVTAPSTGGSLKAYCYDEGASWQLTNVKAGSCGGVSEIGLGYDVQGNLANKNGILYGFDYGNRLRGTSTERYRYDAWGRRVRTDSVLGAGLIYSLYGQDGTLYWTRDERTGRRMQYVYLGGSLIAQRMRPIGVTAETVTWQHTDALGSPVAVTSASRTVLQTSDYEPYGYLLNRPLEDGPGFTGHVMDAATGLIYMQQRYMSVGIPRFLSADPVTAYQQPFSNFNPYAYASNNPYRFRDPDGRQSCPIGTIACMSEKALQGRLDGINAVTAEYSFNSEKAAVKYFSNVANPLTRQSGKEIGANLEQRSEKDLRVIDFHFDKGPQGQTAVSTLPYSGNFTWKGIMHTHPGEQGFSGLGVYGQSGKYRGLYTGSDAQQAVSFGVNSYLSKSNGATQKLDFEGMSRDVQRNVENDRKVYADAYDQVL